MTAPNSIKPKKIKGGLPPVVRGGNRTPRYLELVEDLAKSPDTWFELESFAKTSTAGSFRNTILSNIEAAGYSGDVTTRTTEGTTTVYAMVLSEEAAAEAAAEAE